MNPLKVELRAALVLVLLIEPFTAVADVIVPDYGYFGTSAGVFRFDESSGAAVGGQPVIPPVGSPSNPFDAGYEGDGYQGEGSTYGPDGNLYVGYFIAAANGGTGLGEVRRFNSVTGAYIDTFVAPGSGGLVQPGNLKFGADGNLYVADHGNVIDNVPYGGTSIYKYNSSTGALTGSINFGYPVAPSGLAFDTRPASLGGDPNNLYVSFFNSAQVAQYNLSTHATTIYATGSGMYTPSGIAFGPNGDLYVVNLYTATVQQFHQNATTGLGDYVTSLPSTGDSSFPNGIVFTQGGKLLVSTLGPGLEPGAVLSYVATGPSPWVTFSTSASLSSPGPLTLTPIAGDANADGFVNGLDIALIAGHWLGAGPTGDVDHNGVVNGLDISAISGNWLATNSIFGSGGGKGLAAVPEPATLFLAVLGSIAALGYRRLRVAKK